MTPKPAYERLQQIVRREWWTRASGRTDSTGAVRLRVLRVRSTASPPCCTTAAGARAKS